MQDLLDHVDQQDQVDPRDPLVQQDHKVLWDLQEQSVYVDLEEASEIPETRDHLGHQETRVLLDLLGRMERWDQLEELVKQLLQDQLVPLVNREQLEHQDSMDQLVLLVPEETVVLKVQLDLQGHGVKQAVPEQLVQRDLKVTVVLLVLLEMRDQSVYLDQLVKRDQGAPMVILAVLVCLE
jgi:hypothetical protein